MTSAAIPMENQRPPGESYARKRDALEDYFDRHAAEAWRALTSQEKVSRIRATVRAGRDEMRNHLLSRMPADLSHAHVLDAGCGTGALSVEAAHRGATVTAIDVSPTMIDIAHERLADSLPEGAAPRPGRIDFRAGDMVNDPKGPFDHVVAMDSLIHYGLADILAALATWAPEVKTSILFTIAPRTPALAVMHAVGGLFPRGDRAPAINPIAPRRLAAAISAEPALSDFTIAGRTRVQRGFYTSEAVELIRK